jgi:hypothetical protein
VVPANIARLGSLVCCTFSHRTLRRRRVLAVSLISVLAFNLGSAYVASGRSTTFDACLGQAGGLSNVSVTSPPICNQNQTPVTWNQAGVPGSAGAAGPAGPTGPQGAAGVSGYQLVEGPISNILLGSFGTVTAQCPAGKHVLGGGFFAEGSLSYASVNQPMRNGSGWIANIENNRPPS